MLYVATVALLVITILRAYVDSGQPIWKSSSLLLLFYTVEEPVPIARLRELAERKNMQFVRQGELGLAHLS